jgi:hypothetical protein
MGLNYIKKYNQNQEHLIGVMGAHFSPARTQPTPTSTPTTTNATGRRSACAVAR